MALYRVLVKVILKANRMRCTHACTDTCLVRPMPACTWLFALSAASNIQGYRHEFTCAGLRLIPLQSEGRRLRARLRCVGPPTSLWRHAVAIPNTASQQLRTMLLAGATRHQFGNADLADMVLAQSNATAAPARHVAAGTTAASAPPAPRESRGCVMQCESARRWHSFWKCSRDAALSGGEAQ